MNTWDNRPLQYYTPGQKFKDCARNSAELLNKDNGNGQCGSFKYLLMDALLVNGITMEEVDISAVDSPGTRLLVKDWVFGGADPTLAPYSWQIILQDEGNGLYGMVPLPVGSIYGQMVSLATIPGQHTSPPSEKLFFRHFILKDSTGVNPTDGPYYDPSYGVTYTDACNFEVKAVDGYVVKISDVDFRDPASFHARKVVPGECNIKF